jgi:hypothetical protein
MISAFSVHIIFAYAYAKEELANLLCQHASKGTVAKNEIPSSTKSQTTTN